MKYFILSILDNFGLESLWDVLGRKPAQLFGRECASSAIWIITSLLFRLITILLKLENYVPRGVIFALPYAIQLVARVFPFMRENIPIMPVRLAECMLGRFAPIHLMVVFPAHFLGGIVGVAMLQSIFPSHLSQVFDPIVFPEVSLLFGVCVEIVFVAFYTTAFILIPELLRVNKKSKYWLSLFVVPLFFLPYLSQNSTINPAVVYSLWYVRTRDGYFNDTSVLPVQVEHILGPIIGAVIAGFICLRVCPDDPSSWKRGK